MITERIDLYDYFNMPRKNVTGGYLEVYVRTPSKEINRKSRSAILIFPGGGYEFLSDREGEPVALAFLAKGYSAFVLNYSVNTSYPVPLNEAFMAVAYIRENAETYCVNRDKIAAIGFSAGGHLAGLLATATAEEVKSVPIASSVLPNAVILSYPVVTMGKYTHEGSRRVISAGAKIPYEILSVEKRVTKDSIPAFIWHTVEDNCVPLENSLMLAEAYRRAGVPFSMTVFEKGWHGMSLCNEETDNRDERDLKNSFIGQWFELAIDWLSSRNFSMITLK